MAMKIHNWNLSPKAAVQWQREWAPKVETRARIKKVNFLAGVDVAFTRDMQHAIAAVLVFSFPKLEEVERVYATAPLRFPYIPGLLSFREGPVICKAFKKLKRQPQLLMFDGQGIAHPRRLGIASHLGLILDLPSIGCAKSRLCGSSANPGFKRGDWVLLQHAGETIGAVLRTRDGVRPIYVSVGHRLNLPMALHWALACHDGTRIPKPTREADRWVSQLKRELP